MIYRQLNSTLVCVGHPVPVHVNDVCVVGVSPLKTSRVYEYLRAGRLEPWNNTQFNKWDKCNSFNNHFSYHLDMSLLDILVENTSVFNEKSHIKLPFIAMSSTTSHTFSDMKERNSSKFAITIILTIFVSFFFASGIEQGTTPSTGKESNTARNTTFITCPFLVP